MNNFRLGIDIGRVIIDRRNDKTPTSFFGNNFLQSTPSPNAFDCIAQLTDTFQKQVYLVSKARPENQEKFLAWLEHHNFYNKTSIDKNHVYFCKERLQKKEICTKLGITHFIDDSLEVLSHMIGSVPHLYLFDSNEAEIAPFQEHLAHCLHVENWNTCYKEILKTL